MNISHVFLDTLFGNIPRHLHTSIPYRLKRVNSVATHVSLILSRSFDRRVCLHGF